MNEYVLKPFQCTWTSITFQQMLHLCHKQVSHISYYNQSTQYCLECLSVKRNTQMCWAGAVIMWLKIYIEHSLAILNFNHMPANAAAILQIRKLVSRILTPQLNITSPDNIAICDWGICRTWSVITRLVTDPEHFLLYLNLVGLCSFIVLTSKDACGLRLPVHNNFASDKWFEALCCFLLNMQLMPCIVRQASRECVM